MMQYPFLAVIFLGMFVFFNANADSISQYDYEKSEEKLCKEGHTNIVKKTTQKSVCVKISSVEKLVQRGWAEDPQAHLKISNSIEKQNDPVLISKSIDEQCQFDMDCMVSRMLKLGETHEQRIFEDTVLELLAIYEKRNTMCHSEGHHMGMVLYAYYDDVNKAVSMAGLDCGGALYHGILETHFGVEKFFENSFDEFQANKICTEEFVDSKIKKWECLHGLGHGLTVAYEYDVFEPLKFCNSFEGWELQACARGVFMENIIHVRNTSEGTFDQNDMFYPCNSVEEQFVGDCYLYQTFYLQTLSRGFGSVETTFSLCEGIEPKEFIKFCYVAIGESMVDLYLSIASQLAIDNCQKGDPQYEAYCYVGTMRILADQKNSKHAIDYCNSVPKDGQKTCFEYFGKWADLISETPEEKTLICSDIQDETHFEQCQKSSLNDGDFL
ncbi:MAG: hypothetical protein ACE5RK_06515 [Candidatus Nitrosomaritimum aestuariumsis]